MGNLCKVGEHPLHQTGNLDQGQVIGRRQHYQKPNMMNFNNEPNEFNQIAHYHGNKKNNQQYEYSFSKFGGGLGANCNCGRCGLGGGCGLCRGCNCFGRI